MVQEKQKMPKKVKFIKRKYVWKKENKYICIVKSGEKLFNGSDRFLKYNIRNLLNFTNFLDQNFPSWRWFNVYDKKQGGLQVGNFTKHKRPTSTTI